MKTDSLGNLQWDQSYNIHPNAYYDDKASWVEQTIDGGYILTGHSSYFRYYPEP